MHDAALKHESGQNTDVQNQEAIQNLKITHSLYTSNLVTWIPTQNLFVATDQKRLIILINYNYLTVQRWYNLYLYYSNAESPYCTHWSSIL